MVSLSFARTRFGTSNISQRNSTANSFMQPIPLATGEVPRVLVLTENEQDGCPLHSLDMTGRRLFISTNLGELASSLWAFSIYGLQFSPHVAREMVSVLTAFCVVFCNAFLDATFSLYI